MQTEDLQGTSGKDDHVPSPLRLSIPSAKVSGLLWLSEINKFLQHHNWNLSHTINWLVFLGCIIWACILFSNKIFQCLNRPRSYQKLFFVVVFLPFLQSIAALFTSYSEYNEKMNECIHFLVIGETDWSYIFFTEIPLLISCSLSLYWYGKTACILKRDLLNENGNELLTLVVYPAILIICWEPMLVISLMRSFGIRVPQAVLSAAQALGQLHGFFDAAVYGGSKKRARDLCKGLCCCCKNNAQSQIEESIQIFEEEGPQQLRKSLTEREQLHKSSHRKSSNVSSFTGAHSHNRSNRDDISSL